MDNCLQITIECDSRFGYFLFHHLTIDLPLGALNRNQMQRLCRFTLFLFVLLLVCGCSQRHVKPENSDLNSYAQVEAETISDADPSQTDFENNTIAFQDDEDGVLDSDESLDTFDDEFDEFDEFEDEFGDDVATEVSDPLGGYNRFMTGVNDKLYFWVLKPVATGYSWVVPEIARRGINNFFKNLYYPIRLVNNVLQLKFKNAGEETLRFVTNSTIGVLGLWDPAKVWFGLEAHPEDFGQTFGVWGIGPGPHIVLPILGPSNLRDTIGLAPQWIYLNPVNNISTVSDLAGLEKIEELDKIETKLGILALERVNNTSLRLGEYEMLKKDAIDFYPFVRDLYEQNRQKLIEE
jgi:phospholipid-binding lipoprotein MlaA